MIRSAIAAGLLALLATDGVGAAASDPLIGRWRTQADGGVVEILACGAALCGRVVDGIPLRADPDRRDVRNGDQALRGRKVMGLRVLNGFTGGPREWRGGPVYDPATGSGAKKGYLTLVDRNTLEVKGCLALFLCRTQTWTRVR